MKSKRISLTALLLCAFFLLTACRKSPPLRPEIADDGSYTCYESFISSMPDGTESARPESIPAGAETTGSDTAAGASEAASQSGSLPSRVAAPGKQASTATPGLADLNKTEMRAMWISYIDLAPLLDGKPERKFTENIRALYAKCVQSGMNTVIVHVRSHGDAYYPSRYFPTSIYFTGERGAAAEYDALAIMVREAHRMGLRFEAWLNPYRSACTDWPLTENEATARWLGTDRVFLSQNEALTFYQFNPAAPEVQQLIVDGVGEILDRYPVDGIHFDDYFYPSDCGDCDAAEYEPYRDVMTLAEFRRAMVTRMVKAVYDLVRTAEKKTGRRIVFGISPAGNLNNCMTACYADVVLWGSRAGYVDYLAPQLYWSYTQPPLPYPTALEHWVQTVTAKSVRLYIGLAAYRVGESEYWTDGDILARQIADARKEERYRGFILFRSDCYFSEICDTERENFEKLLK